MSNHYHDDDFDFEEQEPVKPASLAETIAALQLVDEEIDGFLPSDVVYRLATIEEDLDEFLVAWNQLPASRRSWVMRILAELSETDYMISFNTIGYLGLEDPAPEVRASSVPVLWYDDSVEFFELLMRMAQEENPVVRTASVQGLSRFIQAGELLEFDETLAKQAQELAAKYYNDVNQDIEVRRRALEALSHCSRPGVSDMIREAYYDNDEQMKVSAIFAMGSSFDEQWAPMVLAELQSENPELRFEAIGASGNLQLEKAIPYLFEAGLSDDAELQFAAIFALGEIATERAQEALGELAEELGDDADEDVQEAIEDALQEAYMLGSLMPFLDALDEIADDIEDYDEHPGNEYLN